MENKSVSKNFIPISKPSMGEEEIRNVTEVLRSGWLTEGRFTENFENLFAEMTGSKYAVATNNGTSALHILVLFLGIGKGDKVIVPSFSFVSSAKCFLYAGAEPIFVDIDPNTYNIDSNHLEYLLNNNKVKALVSVDLFGQPADYNQIIPICEKFGVPIIEDAAEAHFSSLDGKKSGTFGLGAAFSFYPTKTMTSGEGGMITTDNKDLVDFARLTKNLGRRTVKEEHSVLGYNYRTSDVHAAIGLSQLKNVEQKINRRKKLANNLKEALLEFSQITPPKIADGAEHVFMNYVSRFKRSKIMSRDQFVDCLNEEKIGAKVYWRVPIHLQPFFLNKYSTETQNLPNTGLVCKEVFSLPMFPDMTNNEVDAIILAIRKILS